MGGLEGSREEFSVGLPPFHPYGGRHEALAYSPQGSMGIRWFEEEVDTAYIISVTANCQAMVHLVPKYSGH